MNKTSRELKEENAELSGMLQSITDAINDGKMMKTVCTVVAGPYAGVKSPEYRLDMGGRPLISPVWPEITVLPEVGDQVVVGDNIIFEVLPKELEEKKHTVKYSLAKWEDIVGLNDELRDVRSSVATLSKDSTLYSEFGVNPIKGILLYGPPGCGKTLIGKAIAADILGNNEAEEGQFFFVKGAEMLNKYVGESERQISIMFKKARAYTKRTGNKAIIFIDEAEAILGHRSAQGQVNSFSVVPTFLAEMDGLEADSPFVLLSTNLPSSLDKAIIRDGRIDQRIGVRRPDEAQTAELFSFYLDKVLVIDDKQELITKATTEIFNSDIKSRISGAMVSNIVNQSAKEAAFRYAHDSSTPKGITWDDMNTCIIKNK